MGCARGRGSLRLGAGTSEGIVSYPEKINRLSWQASAIAVAALAIALYVGRSSLGYFISMWFGSEEYSHAPLIPLISGYLLWQRRRELQLAFSGGSWWGCAIAGAGVVLLTAGRLATLEVFQQYGFLVLLYGLLLSIAGWRAFKLVSVPLLLLFFMIPLPQFLLQNFSAELQLISSHIGVALIRLVGISVFVEGNVIDLGTYQLEVAEACSGLRYLFPLMTIGLIVAYLFKAELWKRIVVFLSSIPVTILMNSFRVGMIGVLVEHWGTQMAEGFVHQFEGWVVFMISIGVLLIEVRILGALGGIRRPWRDSFGIDAGIPRAETGASAESSVRIGPAAPMPLLASAGLVMLMAAGLGLLPERIETPPARASFVDFPLHIDDWQGRQSSLDQRYLDQLQLSDYLLADYLRDGTPPVNFYVAWYNSQVAGEAVHSPRSCLPGGGWRVTDFTQRELDPLRVGSAPLRVNRVTIEYGMQRQLVYYWFQQRGRVITNEYLVKWYLFLDSIRIHRTDGALVRLVVGLRPDQAPADADHELTEFAAAVLPKLDSFIPD